MFDNGHILIVDDERLNRTFLRPILETNGYHVHESRVSQDILHKVTQTRPDLVIMDVGFVDGLELLSRLRPRTRTPILVLSASDADRDRTTVLEAGADAYLVKPFHIDDLMSQILLIQQAGHVYDETSTFTSGELHVDLTQRLVRVNQKDVQLTPTEYALLRLLIRNAGRVLTYEQILKSIWGPEHITKLHYVRVYFAQLRQKLEMDPSRPRLLLTEPGIGYRLMTN